jgi:pimeloyl-ACP methyl ester carboxylesterase
MLWSKLAELPLVVEACEYERLHAVLAHESERITTHVRLIGAGADGLGEDVSVHREDGNSLHEARPALPLAGEWTPAGFCGLELPPERGYVVSLNETMRVRARVAAQVAGFVASNAVTRTAVLAPMRTRPWRVPRDDAAAEIRDFARSPGFQPTIRWTVATRVASGLRDIAVPARVCFGTRDVMLGAFTAPRFAAAIPQADLVPLPGCGHVPMADAPDRVARAITEVTAPG